MLSCIRLTRLTTYTAPLGVRALLGVPWRSSVRAYSTEDSDNETTAEDDDTNNENAGVNESDISGKARKGRKSHRADSMFSSEEEADSMYTVLYAMEVLNQHRTQQPPVFSPALGDRMHRLRVAEPDQWPIERLAQRFRLKKVHVAAILRMREEEDRMRQISPELIYDDEVDLARGEVFGMVGEHSSGVTETDMRWHLNQSRQLAPSWTFVEEEVDQASLSRALSKPITPFPKNLANTPPSSENGVTRVDGTLIQPAVEYPNPGKKRQRGNRAAVMMFDISEEVTREDGDIRVFEADGSIRHATWEERQKLHYKKLPRPKYTPADRAQVDPFYFNVEPISMSDEVLNNIDQQDVASLGESLDALGFDFSGDDSTDNRT